jgi:hypothetical protein
MRAVQASAPEQVSVARRMKADQHSATLEANDVKELRHYSKQDPAFASSHSSFSAQLERAALLAVGSLNCTRCGGINGTKRDTPGRGFLPMRERIPYAEQLRRYRVRECKKNGWSWRRSPREVQALRGKGLDAYTWANICEFYRDLPELNCRLCPECGGRGITSRMGKQRKQALTARPTGGSRRGASGGSSAEVGEDALHRRGRVDRRLARVRTACPAVAGILDTYYAPGNETLRSLWRYTATGRELLGQGLSGLGDRAKIANILDHQHRHRDQGRQRVIDNADAEARELLDLACRTWNAVIAEDVKRSALDVRGRPIEPDQVVWGLLDGQRRRGIVQFQDREYWVVRFAASPKPIFRDIHGWHLEVAA